MRHPDQRPDPNVDDAADEIRRLRSCINDLISVLALPALWSGSDPSQVVGTLLDVLLAMLRLDFACARLSDSSDGPPIQVVRWGHRQHPSGQPRHVLQALDRWLTGDQTASRFVVRDPSGEGDVSIASFSLGLQHEVGVLAVGSRRAGFPTEVEGLLLRVAANQAAIGLQEALRAGEQKRVAAALEQRVAERTRQLTAVNEDLRRSIEDRKRAEMVLAGEKRLLEMIARGDPLAPVLHELCMLVEELVSGSLSSILLLDPRANRLRHGAAPSLPLPYTQAIDGSVIGPSVGSCGTAAYRAEPVIVSDIATDPLWADFRGLALAHGLRACWSTPILSSTRSVLGTFAIYYREPRSPTPQEHNLIEQITHLASIAVEREQAEEAQKRAEEALRQAQEDLAHVSRVTTMGEMAASIAHEVDQPLSGVVINANACLRFLAGASPNLDEVRDGLQAIARDGRRASEVTARIRTLARRTPSEKHPQDINAIIGEVVALAEGETRRTRTKVRTELAASLPRVLGDAVLLQQVVLNLLLNGLEAMNAVDGRPRELVIRTEEETADRVRVAVRDSGPGIDPEHARRMFDAFYSTKRGGLGMGLSISRTIIEQHGGRLWATPNDGPGTTFYFTV
jgi:signal transduction histidine kinase